MVETLTVELGERSYPIMVGSKTLDYLGEAVMKLGCGSRLLVVTNETVGPLYGERVKNSLQKAGFNLLYCELPDGEEFKSLQSAEKLYTVALEGGLERRSAVIALGGGVIGDLTGFVAATYMRGVPYIQVPTTLLAQVDSSVGGKVAVNHPMGKNMIGCFYQPLLTFADVEVLHTLAAREVYAGLAEVIKYGVICDPSFFCFLEGNIKSILTLDEDAITTVIKRSCAIKAEVVEKDEREQGLRAILNFGHTVGHALEALTGYRLYRHGEAVAIGMVVAATISVGRGLLQEEERRRLVELLIKAELPVLVPFAAEEIIPLLLHDKKACEGRPHFVLPLSLGEAALFSDVEADEVRVAVEKCRERKVAD